jgi:MoaA/NifB/PqqE/SkfB family radical SAM enzyme
MKLEEVNIVYVQKLKEGRVPLLGEIELTDRCNLNCIHCCVHSDDRHAKGKELTTKQVFRIVGQMRDEGVVYLNFSGGEPLFRGDFSDIYLFAKKKGFAVTVITNGTLITCDIIELFQHYPPLMLEITGYGLSRATHDAVTRVPGSFDMLQKALRLLEASGIRTNVRQFVIKKNYPEIMRADRHDVHYVLGMPLILRRDRDAQKNATIKKQRLTADEVRRFSQRYQHGTPTMRLKSGQLRRYLDVCQCDTLSGAVLSDGTFTRCHLMPSSSCNLKTMSYREAWQRSCPAETMIEQQDRACGKCAHIMYCKWCPGRAFLETGSPKKKIPYLCSIMEHIYERGGR